MRNLGRRTLHCVACNPASAASSATPIFSRITSYSQASDDMSHDVIFGQTKTVYDPGNNVIRVTHWRRSPQAAWGALGVRRGKLLSETVAPQARVSHAVFWRDALGRVVAEADYGANGVATVVRPEQIPNSSDSLPVTRTRYSARGELYEQVDAAGRSSISTYDAGQKKGSGIFSLDAGSAS